MADDDLADIIASLDDGSPDRTPAYTEDLWVELRRTLARADAEAPAREAVADVIELECGARRQQRKPRSGRVVMAIAAIAACAVLVAGIALRGDRVQTDPTPPIVAPTSVPSLEPDALIPQEACANYLDSGATLEEAAVAIEDGTATAETIDAARAALSALESELARSGEFSAGDLGGLEVAVVQLGQATLQLEAGDEVGAAATLRDAESAVSGISFPPSDGGVIRATCIPQ